MEQEIWKDIPGYEGKYAVSNLGRAKSLYFKNGACEFYRDRIIGGNHSEGYRTINLNRKLFFIHRLVAQAFIQNPENKPQVNHKNSIRNDNRVENLEWATSKENNIHGYNIGYHNPVKHTFVSKIKISSGHRKLSDENIKDIYSLLKEGKTHKFIGELYSVNPSTISDIRNNKYLYLR